MSVENPIPSISQIFSSPLFKIENIILGGGRGKGGTIHNDKMGKQTRKRQTENIFGIFVKTFQKWGRWKQEENDK